MSTFVSIGIPVTAFVLMLVVGLDCTTEGFKSGMRRRGLLSVVTIAQFACIPGVMVGTALLLDLPSATTAALLLIGACPSGTISNTYTFVAKGSSPLSVLFTVLSSIVALLLTPLALAAWSRASGGAVEEQLTLPFSALLKQFLIMLAVPVTLGYLLRRHFTAFAERQLKNARILSLVLLVFLLSFIVAGNFQAVVQQLRDLFLPVILITVALLVLSFGIARLFRLPRNEQIAVLFEFPCRNLAIAALVGLNVLNRPELVISTTSFFLLESLVLAVLAIGLGRAVGVARKA